MCLSARFLMSYYSIFRIFFIPILGVLFFSSSLYSQSKTEFPGKNYTLIELPSHHTVSSVLSECKKRNMRVPTLKELSAILVSYAHPGISRWNSNLWAFDQDLGVYVGYNFSARNAREWSYESKIGGLCIDGTVEFQPPMHQNTTQSRNTGWVLMGKRLTYAEGQKQCRNQGMDLPTLDQLKAIWDRGPGIRFQRSRVGFPIANKSSNGKNLGYNLLTQTVFEVAFPTSTYPIVCTSAVGSSPKAVSLQYKKGEKENWSTSMGNRNFSNAKKACESAGMRLPTSLELMEGVSQGIFRQSPLSTMSFWTSDHHSTHTPANGSPQSSNYAIYLPAADLTGTLRTEKENVICRKDLNPPKRAVPSQNIQDKATDQPIVWSDYLGRMNILDAVVQCRALGMRLPTIGEMNREYEAGIIAGWGRSNALYWTGTRATDRERVYKVIDSDYGYNYDQDEFKIYDVRCMR